MKIKTFLLVIFILIFSNIPAYSQTPNNELEKFNQYIRTKIDLFAFKDSTALYTFNMQISVDKKRDYKPVIKSSNWRISNRIAGLPNLDRYDYKKMMARGDHYVKFILPISIVVIGSSDKKNIPLHLIEDVSALFFYPIEEEEHRKIVYLAPLIYTFDKKTEKFIDPDSL